MNNEGGFLKPKFAKKAPKAIPENQGFSGELRLQFPFEPTPGQLALFDAMEVWFLEKNIGRQVFVLRGYAGTGKTAFLGALVKAVKKLPLKIQLMAPTGRASKVMSSYSGKTALTIHKRIFRFGPDDDGMPRLRRQRNTATQTLFVVDEASMLGNQPEFGSKGILEELIRYVFEDESNRLLIIGDSAQLPPVGTDLSPALKPEWLSASFGLSVSSLELTGVVRQEADSGILENATRLRDCIRLKQPGFTFQLGNHPDVYKMGKARILEGIDYAYRKYGMERSLVLTRTNRQANRYNQAIRRQILFREEEIENGDWIMVVKNNYAQGGEGNDFLANGELGLAGNVGIPGNDYPVRLCRMEIRFPEMGKEGFETYVVMLDLLHSDLPQAEDGKLKELQDYFTKEWQLENEKPAKIWQRLRTEPDANPLQLKFGYALTCHKAQGGQWDAVFIDHGYMRENEPDTEFYRWLYTALTRAKKEVFLLEPDSRLLG
jgi:exodeoxyribonuclease-5